ncbi:DMT family transporter [Halovivax limisalsi]|uniref:DMT family transporter n=1 Tax=Halovivax limisalsi TaxID=1453760 RepID=UPI001FFCC4A9|nr:EamA family transporter [Halovivax limisalsi]
MSRRSALGFVLLAVVWGSSFPAVKVGVEHAPPVLFAALRFDGIALFVLAVAVLAGGRVLPGRADLAGIVAGGVLVVGLHNLLWFLGQQSVTSAVGAVVIATVPILAAGFSRVLLPDERIGIIGLAGLALGFLGTAIVARPTGATLSGPHAIGVGLIFVSAVAMALGTVLVQSTRSDLPVAAMQGWMMVLGAAVMHAASLGLGETQAVAWTPRVGLALAYLVLIAGTVGYLLYFHLLDALGSVELTLVNYVIPVVAAATGWLVLDEGIEVTTVVGFVVVLAGFALVKRRALRSLLRRYGDARLAEPTGSQDD